MANFVWPFQTGSGGGGVTDLNGLTGSVTLIPGTNVAFTPTGNGFTIDVTGGSGTVTGNGLTNAVAYWTDSSNLAGDNRFEFDPTTGALLLVDAVQNIKIGNITNQASNTISIGVGNTLSAGNGQTVNIGNASTGNAGGNNTLVGNNIVAEGGYTGSIVLGDEAHLTANFQMVFGAQSGSNKVTSWVIHGDSYDVATNFAQQEGFLYNSSSNKWAWSGIQTDATLTGSGTVSSPLSVVSSGVLPIYPTNLIVFGDGTTPGGITDTNFTHNPSSNTTNIITPFVSGARTISSFGPNFIQLNGSSSDFAGGGFNYTQINAGAHTASVGLGNGSISIYSYAGIDAAYDSLALTSELILSKNGLHWRWAPSDALGFMVSDGSQNLSFSALDIGTGLSGDGITTSLSVIGNSLPPVQQLSYGGTANLTGPADVQVGAAGTPGAGGLVNLPTVGGNIGDLFIISDIGAQSSLGGIHIDASPGLIILDSPANSWTISNNGQSVMLRLIDNTPGAYVFKVEAAYNESPFVPLPALSQFHIYIGNGSNLPVDAGNGLIYDPASHFLSNVTDGATFTSKFEITNTQLQAAWQDTGGNSSELLMQPGTASHFQIVSGGVTNAINLLPGASELITTDGSFTSRTYQSATQWLGNITIAGQTTGLDLSQSIATLGDQGGGNSTLLTVDDGSKIIKTRGSASDDGIYLDLNASSYTFGKVTGGNGTKINVDDSAQVITLGVVANGAFYYGASDGSLEMQGKINGTNVADILSLDPTSNRYQMGDITGQHNSTFLDLNDGSLTITLRSGANQSVSIDPSNGFLVVAGVNNTEFQVNDSTQQYIMSKLGGSGTRVVTADPSGILGTTVAVTVSGSADLTAQSGTVSSVTSVTPSANTTYEVDAYINVTAITAGTVTLSITFTDVNSVSQTITLPGITTTGYTSYIPQVVRAKSGFPVTVVSTFTGISTTYDVGARIIGM